jgi:hypothetical protein
MCKNKATKTRHLEREESTARMPPNTTYFQKGAEQAIAWSEVA